MKAPCICHFSFVTSHLSFPEVMDAVSPSLHATGSGPRCLHRLYQHRRNRTTLHPARVSPSPAIVAGLAVRRGICKHDRFWHRHAQLHRAVASVFESPV
jgi:hypothetical protein